MRSWMPILTGLFTGAIGDKWPTYVFLGLIAAGEGTIYLLARKAWKAAPIAHP
jgi:hypothetical protein